MLKRTQEAPHEAGLWFVERNETTEKAKWKYLPIHTACGQKPPLKVIKALYDAYPDGVRYSDADGKLLFTRCMYHTTYGMIPPTFIFL